MGRRHSVRAASAKAAVIRFTKLGFLKQVRVKRDQPHWLTDEEGQADRAQDHHRRLGRDWRRRRRQGRGAARAGAEAPGQEGRRAGRGSARGRRASRRVEARTDHRADAGRDGATLNDMVEATGWLPHTTRAALTGLRHKGYAIVKSRNAEAETVYRIDAAEGTSSTGAEEARA